jgi:hypothetical protein
MGRARVLGSFSVYADDRDLSTVDEALADLST